MSDWLPPRLFEYGAELAAAADRRLGAGVVGDARRWIEMPRRLEATGPSSQPVCWGTGALCVDLGPDDGETWERFAEVHQGESDPEAVAAAAQEWRLPITPYHRLPMTTVEPGTSAPSREPTSPASLDERAGTACIRGARVIDLTSMWAGPLCTELLGRAGAHVSKVTSQARPDGLADSAMYDELNAHKTAVELDPRFVVGQRTLEDMLASADLLVTSLSPRALANLDLLPEQLGARHPQLRTVAITAFEPDSPERDWIAYGTGVHAASGLGWLGDEPQAPVYSYPDPLAGLLAAHAAADQLAGAASQHTRVSLAGALAPLAGRSACNPAADNPVPAADSLRQRARRLPDARSTGGAPGSAAGSDGGRRG